MISSVVILPAMFAVGLDLILRAPNGTVTFTADQRSAAAYPLP